MFLNVGNLLLLFVHVLGTIEENTPSGRNPKQYFYPILNPIQTWTIGGLPYAAPKLTYSSIPYSLYSVNANSEVGNRQTGGSLQDFPIVDIFNIIDQWKKEIIKNKLLGNDPTTPGPPGNDPTTPTPPVLGLPCECGIRNPSKKIVGGKDAGINEYPWMAALCFGTPCSIKNLNCGGSLINDLYILTAAHCVDDKNNKVTTVSLGDHDIDSNDETTPVVLKVVETIIHSEYDAKTFLNDIALLKLEAKPPITDKIRPICLPKYAEKHYDGDDAVVTGWGHTTDKGKFANILQELVVPVPSIYECNRILPKEIPMTKLCAGETGAGHCNGDSGGPLVTEIQKNKFEQIGIVSTFLEKCGDYPGIYTRVTEYLDWIKHNTKEATYCAN